MGCDALKVIYILLSVGFAAIYVSPKFVCWMISAPNNGWGSKG